MNCCYQNFGLVILQPMLGMSLVKHIPGFHFKGLKYSTLKIDLRKHSRLFFLFSVFEAALAPYQTPSLRAPLVFDMRARNARTGLLLD